MDFYIDLDTVNRSTTSTHRSCKSSGNRHSCPKASRYTTSTDGKRYQTAGRQTNTVLREPFFGIKQFDCDFAPRPVRYVRVRVKAMELCPASALLCGRRCPVFHRRDRRAQSRLLTFTANIPASCAKAKKPVTALIPQAFREPSTNSARKPVRTA
ncbi:MAG: hypothetical protein ACLR8Y_00570 [Alistipes indistinctus]